jgi:hypothetical protein
MRFCTREKTTKILNTKIPLWEKITKVDLQNPLKIVLFYESFNSALLLDNQLNEIQKINFPATQTQ